MLVMTTYVTSFEFLSPRRQEAVVEAADAKVDGIM
jgi:hypothetical protein